MEDLVLHVLEPNQWYIGVGCEDMERGTGRKLYTYQSATRIRNDYRSDDLNHWWEEYLKSSVTMKRSSRRVKLTSVVPSNPQIINSLTRILDDGSYDSWCMV